MYTALRRATAAAVPLLSRRASATSSRTFHSSIAVNLLRHKETTHFVPSHSFAYSVLAKTTADDTLLQLLDTEINRALEDIQNVAPNLEFPGYFPFEIVDNPGEGILQLKRQFEDETITVQVDISDVSPQLREDKDNIPSFVPLVVSVFKGNGACLEFEVIAYRNRKYVMISRMSLKKPDESEDPLAYNERRISDLDEDLGDAFLTYLEIRGIAPNITNVFVEILVQQKLQQGT